MRAPDSVVTAIAGLALLATAMLALLPVVLRLWRVLKRTLRGGNRPDMPEGCPEGFHRETLPFWRYIWRTRRSARPAGPEAHNCSAPDTGAAQVVRLPKKDTSEHYYLSLRQSIGLDANLESAYKNVVSVHKASGKMPTKTVKAMRGAP